MYGGTCRERPHACLPVPPAGSIPVAQPVAVREAQEAAHQVAREVRHHEPAAELSHAVPPGQQIKNTVVGAVCVCVGGEVVAASEGGRLPRGERNCARPPYMQSDKDQALHTPGGRHMQPCTYLGRWPCTRMTARMHACVQSSVCNAQTDCNVAQCPSTSSGLPLCIPAYLPTPGCRLPIYMTLPNRSVRHPPPNSTARPPSCRRPEPHASKPQPFSNLDQVSAVEKVIDEAAAVKASLSEPAAHELDKFRQEEDPLHGHGIDHGMALAGAKLT